MQAWRGWNSSKKELVCRRVEKCRTTKSEHEDARTAAETKAKETRERSRVIKQQQRFRDVRDEQVLIGDRMATVEILVGQCVLDFTGLYEADRVLYLSRFFNEALMPDG